MITDIVFSAHRSLHRFHGSIVIFTKRHHEHYGKFDDEFSLHCSLFWKVPTFDCRYRFLRSALGIKMGRLRDSSHAYLRGMARDQNSFGQTLTHNIYLSSSPSCTLHSRIGIETRSRISQVHHNPEQQLW